MLIVYGEIIHTYQYYAEILATRQQDELVTHLTVGLYEFHQIHL